MSLRIALLSVSVRRGNGNVLERCGAAELSPGPGDVASQFAGRSLLDIEGLIALARLATRNNCAVGLEGHRADHLLHELVHLQGRCDLVEGFLDLG